ncbi:BrnA antitoxin of type II toxin-antitoxin system [Monaibacterium marinum]|uniref:BrnA antitoxin of type II toxin-antitoxin system n=1 Tax=Pontivivens marinum TaxID=1690039 RepID=A0A2C9CN95_9RHOB|nr:BrnA antitoxin family protein [Monaibacterium marinum]SOH92866.1 BrnA antitoxin of type II toxin-antitoxin system [Monaibacterium marinum]
MAGEYYNYTEIPERKKTKAEIRKEMELTILLSEQKIEMSKMMNELQMIPTEWRDIEGMFPCKPRGTKVTLRLDDDMVKFYRAMGTGWHARVNGILRAWMLARLAKVIEGDGDEDWLGRPL